MHQTKPANDLIAFCSTERFSSANSNPSTAAHFDKGTLWRTESASAAPRQTAT